MTTENSSSTPIDDAESHSSSESPSTATAPEQGELSTQGKKDAGGEKSTGKELAREFRWFEVGSLTINGALAIIGIIALCIYGGQLNALLESNKINREALTSVQRAFVFVPSFDVTRLFNPITKKADGIQFVFQWENGGTTPTKDMSTHVSCQWRPDPLPKNFDFPDLWNKGEEDHIPFKMFVGPKATSRTAPPIVVPRSEVVAIQDHVGHLYFWGWARYKDTFPNTAEHFTRFCTELTAINGDLQAPTLNIQTINCRRGNCYDEECEALDKP